nr:DUF294 nucleotidyltransferase-like domain-containing protein [Coralloluteibacterium stylophorae]
MPEADIDLLARRCGRATCAAGDRVPAPDTESGRLHIVVRGAIEIRDAQGGLVSRLGPGDCFGGRGLHREGAAATTVRALQASVLLQVPDDLLDDLVHRHPFFAGRVARSDDRGVEAIGLAAARAADLVLREPVTCTPQDPVAEVAGVMRRHDISCVPVVDGTRLLGIVTTGDLTRRVLADGRDPRTPVATVMTRDPLAVAPTALGADILHTMLQARIGHLPVVAAGRLLGVVTRTDLTRYQALLASGLVAQVEAAADAVAMAAATASIPRLLVQLVEANTPHYVATRLITDIADAATRRLLALAEAELGPPPVPYVWLACGSQGRQEQSGVTDQDNCLFIDDAAREADLGYFQRLATFVCDGLHRAGYLHCPGDMMAMNPRWCQPLRAWRRYFHRWIAQPDPEARMLASVMFDLRPVAGTTALFAPLQAETLAAAAARPVFVAHMIANALQHAPPLGVLRGLSTIRTGAHRRRLDMKHAGVVPVVDLARLYALQGRIASVGTRSRLQAAAAAGVVSASGARDLVEAYDVIASLRLTHQARLVRSGHAPDNYLAPAELSGFERGHLRDAFVVVRGMQAALGHGRAAFT